MPKSFNSVIYFVCLVEEIKIDLAKYIYTKACFSVLILASISEKLVEHLTQRLKPPCQKYL